MVRALQEVPSKDAKELLHILGKHPFENLMFCHDKVGATQVIPELTEEEELLTKVSEYTEDSIKIVRIEKTSEPLVSYCICENLNIKKLKFVSFL